MRAVRITRACWLNDRVNGDPGSIRTLDDAEAYEAVEVHKVAAYAPEHDPVTFVGPEAAAEHLDAIILRMDAPEPAVPYEADLIPEKLEMKRPYGNASKAAWIDWAVHNGADPQEIAGWTKNELMGRYGERL